MIIFNGVSIDQVAPIKIVDIRVSPIQMTVVARQRPVTWGADYVRMSGGSRTVAIEFALLTEDREARQTQLAALTRWARSDKPEKPEKPDQHDFNVYANLAAETLTSTLGRTVKIVNGRKKGRVELEYYGVDDLNDLLDALAALKKAKRGGEKK